MPTRLTTAIDTAIADRRLLLPETREILDAAGETISTTGARKLGELYEKLSTTSPAPAGRVYATASSRQALDSRFAAAGLPFGNNASTMQAQLARLFETAELGAQLSRAPRTTSLLSLILRDQRETDGVRQTVFFTADAHRAFLRVDGGGRGQPRARWYGPLDLHALAQSAQIQPLREGQITPERMNWIRTSLQRQLSSGALTFNETQPPPGKMVELGTLHIDAARAAYTVLLPVQNHGENLENNPRYAVKRELDGATSYSTETAILPFESPGTDGRLSDAMRTRARNIYFDLERREAWNWSSRGPSRDKHVVFHALRGAAPTGAFVVARNADGSSKDPDYSTEVWFRHTPSDQWSGPHAIEPLLRD